MDTGQTPPNLDPPVGAEKSSNPPHWLQVGDESWGPTDLQKRKARPLPLPVPRLPIWAPFVLRRSRRPTQQEPSLREAALYTTLVIVVALPALCAGIWLQRATDPDSTFICFVGCLAALFAELFAFLGVLWVLNAVKGRGHR